MMCRMGKIAVKTKSARLLGAICPRGLKKRVGMRACTDAWG